MTLPDSSESSARHPTRGGVRPDERALAPDLARGVMLLLIVLSNTGFYLYAASHGPSGWHPVGGGTADAVAQFAMITGLDLRTYPMFAFLFGYGMMRLFERQTESGTSPRGATAILRRRSLWLIVLGAAHAGLLMTGDILGTYGLISLVLGWIFLRRSNRALLIAVAVVAALLVLLTGVTVLDGLAGTDTSATRPDTVLYASGETGYLASVTTRLGVWSIGIVLMGSLFGFAFHCAMLLGFLAARHRVLEEPARHLRLLWAAAIGGIAIGWLGGLPVALDHVGTVDLIPDAMHGPEGPVMMWQTLTGLPAGVGYAALFGLIAHGLSRRVRASTPVVAVAALGKRSLSGYLGHSVLFSPVLAAWGLGVGAHLGSATMALFAVVVWLVTVVAAYGLERAGRRGPAEALLRRLMYGRANRSPVPR